MDKRFFIRPFNKINFLLMLLLATLLAGCIKDDNNGDDCGSGLRIYYRYDYNMEFADAFHSQVHRVDLYIFDEDECFVRKVTDQGAALANNNYYMEVDLEPGTYHFVVWAGLIEESFEEVETMEARISEKIHLKVALLMEEDHVSDHELQALWHGEKESVVVTGKGYEETTVSLIKDTNDIRVILQQVNGVPMSVDDFYFEITDDNSLLNYDNRIIPNGTVTYHACYQGELTLGDVQPVSVVYFEANTSRLVEDSEARLRVLKASDGSTVIDIPLIDYLLLTEMEGYKGRMTNDEYLNRQHEYSLIFFLDPNLSWLQTEIIVNGWTVRFNNGELE